MRNIFLTSTAAVCLMLTVPLANAQTDSKKHEETKKEQVKQPSGTEHQQQAQERQQKRSTTGQASENKETGKHESNKSESRKENASKDTAASSETKDQNAAGKAGNETSEHAKGQNSKREKSKSAAEQDKKSAQEKSTANESEKKSTADEHNKADQKAKPSAAEAPNSSSQKRESASTPSSNTNAKTAPADNAVNNKADSNKNATGTNVTDKAATAGKAGQLDPQKKVQISETISRTHDLAPPVRNLNISITVGERVPGHVHLRPLPREIVTIAPEYRGYDYFTTEEDVVIVSPRTHEIVTEIPRDASRARAQLSTSSTTSITSSNASGAGSMPCQVMQRSASGDTQPMDPSRLRETTGSGASKEHLAVKVKGPDGQEMPEVALPDRQGRIIAETNGSDCRIIIEPGQANR